jgi:Zn-dependent M28 family amino/carboxypeptidase
MLEIARYFREKLPSPACQLEFVALGAEEVGMVGSRTFVARHDRDLVDCELLFNIDTVGGGGAIYIEMRGGVQGISAHKGESQIPPGLAGKAETDSGGRWGWLQPQLLAPLMASCVPEWLKQEIKAAAAELGYAFTPANYMGSDHLVFAQAGIPATNIGVSGSEVHGPADTLDKISPQSLEKASAIVIRVVEKTMARIAIGN